MSTFNQLQKFISEDMRMSQVYQPVMLIELLKNGGEATVTQIAQANLAKKHMKTGKTRGRERLGDFRQRRPPRRLLCTCAT